MEKSKNSLEKRSSQLLAILFSVGAVGHNIPVFFPYMLQLTPYTLYISAIIILSVWLKNTEWLKKLQWLAISFIFSFSSEAAGVHFGFPFGNYSYGSTLGFRFLGVPCIIGINWVLIILGITQLMYGVKLPAWIKSLIVGFVAMCFDLLLEPVAIKLGYWQWATGSIPMSNYISWFSIASIIAFLYYLLQVNDKSKITLYYFIMQSAFFLILYFGLV